MNNTIETRNNRYVIRSREEQLKKMIQKTEVTKPYSRKNGLIKLTRTPGYERLRLLQKLKDLEYEIPQTIVPNVLDIPVSYQESIKKKNKKKGKNKKQKYKDKKGAKKMSKHISEFFTERNERSGNLMAELMKKTEHLAIVNKILWVYNSIKGCYESSDVNNVSSKLRSLLPEGERMKVSSQEYKEAYSQLMITDELVSEEPFFANGPYINCLNGVVDVVNGKLLPHDPSYRFKHCLRVNYNPNAKCKKFLKFVETITGGDDELKDLLKVIFGYILSHYNNAKTAFLLWGPSNVGKSVVCKIFTEIIGEDFVKNSDLDDLQKQEFIAGLAGMLLNVAPDLKNGVLKDVGAFKALTSHNDTIAARALYANPCKVTGETKMLFSTNHLIKFDSKLDIGDIEAVFNRLLYFPFMNKPVTEDEDNKNLSKELLEEKEGVFLFALEGLKMYISNGERFPHAKESQKIKIKNMAQFCPEKSFFDKCIIVDEDSCESTEVVKKAYEYYCKSNEITDKGNLKSYIMEHKKIFTKKKELMIMVFCCPKETPDRAT